MILCINIRNGTVVLFKDDEAYSYLSIVRYALKFINEFVFFFSAVLFFVYTILLK